MTNTELNTITNATVELGRKTTHTVTELSTRTLKDIAAYTETLTKAQTEMFRSNPSTSIFGDIFDTWTKMQSEMVKGYTQWTDSIRSNFGK